MTVAPQLTTMPLTASQQGLLVVRRTVPVPQLYNVVAELELDPGLATEELRQALTAVLSVQPALRLAVREAPAPHAVLVPTPQDPPLRVIRTAPEQFESGRTELLAEIGNTVIDPEQAPMLRAVLLRAADGSRSALLLVVHHLVFDGFSLRLFARDLTAAVRGELDVDGLRTARERALHKELDAQLSAAGDERVEHAARELADRLRAVPATVLYPRPNRPAVTDFSGSRREIRLSPAESQRVDEVCAALGVSSFTFFCAVYALLLGRHSSNPAVVFGSPVVARRTIGSFDLCGFFVNTLPLIIDLPWDERFDTFVRQRVRAETDRVKSNAALSFDRIVRQVEPDRSTNRNPVFSCMLAMQDAAGTEPDSVVRRMREHGNGTAKFDLWLGVTPTSEGLLLELEYDRKLLPDAMVSGLADSLLSAVRRITDRPETVLSELFDDVSLAESRAHDGYRRRPPHADLHRWVCEAAAQRPDAIAVEEDGRSLTYGELDALVRSAAAGLAHHGAGPGTVVGLTTPTLKDTVVAILATLARRAVFLPLDLGLPADRLAYMAKKTDCRLVIGEGTVEGADVVPLAGLTRPGGPLPDTPGPGPRPGQDGKGPDGKVPDGEGPEGDGVYVMFTSGSTGHPKGVLMTNGPLVNLTAWQLDALEMDEHTRFLQYAPLGFDVSFQEILPTLVAGGTLVAREPADRRDLPAVLARVRAEGVSHVYLPVAALRPFVRAAQAAGQDLPELRYLCVSGEQLLLDDGIQSFFAERPHIRLVNLYGPTETHAVTTHRLMAGTQPWPAHTPIGRPLTGVSAYVRDRTGHLAPCGVAGELYLGGACTARGYVNDPVRTAERFLPDPHAGQPDARMYRTGDQVLRDEHGDLVFLGRDDDQVKIRGYRVELGELESAAGAHPGVQLAVAAVLGSGHDRQLVLFFVPETGRCPDPEDVRRRMTGALPGYMVPTRIFAVERVPTTRNGKVDRTALLQEAEQILRTESLAGSSAVTTTDDPLEIWLQELWGGLLGRAGLPIDRSLLDYGAHSLNVLTALSATEHEHGVQIPILDFFLEPTISAQATLIKDARGGAR